MNTTVTNKPVAVIDVDNIIASICNLVKCSEDEYAEVMYKNGLAYLQWYLPCDQHAKKQLERSKLYWNWFKKQYRECDKAYIQSPGIALETLKERRRLYRELHDPKALVIDLKPNRIVLAEINKNKAYDNVSL